MSAWEFGSERQVRKVMYTVEEVSAKILAGKRLLLAGDSALLDRLPRGSWIGGTIPYFMTESGGRFTKDLILVNELPEYAVSSEIRVYNSSDIGNVYIEAPDNGISVIILPSFCPTHFEFALNVTKSEAFASKPLIGWVAGSEMSPSPLRAPRAYCGETGKSFDDGAVVMHVALPSNRRAEINIVNFFRQDGGDTFMFLEDGFSASDVLVNGKLVDFGGYIERRGIDTRFPLVADYFGSMINISFQSVDRSKGEVHFYAPVFRGVEYKLAAPIDDYVSLFSQNMPEEPLDSIFFSCNCILNYFHSELENKKTGGITGPITFGEIAYQLLNQTLVYAVIRETT